MRYGHRLIASFIVWSLTVGTLSAQSTVFSNEADEAYDPLPVFEIAKSSPQYPRSCRITGGASFYHLKPYADGNTAYQTTTITTGPVGGATVAQGQITNQNFDWGMKPAGAIWLGIVNPSGFGIRGRDFFFDATTPDALVSLANGQDSTPIGVVPSVTNVINPSPHLPQSFPGALPPVVAGTQSFSSPSQLLSAGFGQDDLLFSSSLRINAFDLEPTYAWSSGRWSFLAGAGVRYLSISQAYRATLQNLGAGTPATEFETLDVSNKYWGVGPTLSGNFTRTIGSTGLSLFATAHGSLLAGNANRQAAMMTCPHA